MELQTVEESTCTRLTRRLESCFAPHAGNGRLAVLEGVPGAGKTTCLRWASEFLAAVAIPQLDHTVEQEWIPEDRAAHWYVTAEVARQEFVRATLATPRDVVQDRNVLSTLAFAYARARRFGDGECFTSVVRMILRDTKGLLVRPDVLVVLTVDPELGLMRRRRASGEPRFEVWRDSSFLKHHAAFYDEFAGAFPADVVTTIDTTTLTSEETTLAVAQAMLPRRCGQR